MRTITTIGLDIAKSVFHRPIPQIALTAFPVAGKRQAGRRSEDRRSL